MEAEETRRRSSTGRLLWFAVPAAAVVFVAASSPWVAQHAPRFLFPALGAAGAGVAVFSFVRSLTGLLRRNAGKGRVRLLRVLVNVIAATFLVAFPVTHVLRAVTAPRDGAPRILTGFGDWLGAEGYPRPSPHRGIDVAGSVGADVLAAADGRVTVARDNHDLCGLIVVIEHDPYGYRTVYCHFSKIAVRPGDRVERGERIGAIGTSGQRAWPGFEHVHLELQRGRDMKDVEDPLPRIIGCFDRTTRYPSDRLALTYPVKC